MTKGYTYGHAVASSIGRACDCIAESSVGHTFFCTVAVSISIVCAGGRV